MKDRQKISFGFTSILLLFFVIYAVFLGLKSLPLFSRQSQLVNEISQELGSFNEEEKSTGALGGFHSFEDLRLESQGDFYRLSLNAPLNRAVIGEELAVPFTQVSLREGMMPISGGGETLGNYYLEVVLSDTTPSISSPVFTLNQGPLTQAYVVEEESRTRLYIGLKDKLPFRLGSSGTDGEVYIDIYQEK